MIMSVNFKYLTLFLVAIAIYLIWMDVGFYLELQKMPLRSPAFPDSPKLNISAPYIYSPFHPITVKLLMLPATIQVTFFSLLEIIKCSNNIALSPIFYSINDETVMYSILVHS